MENSTKKWLMIGGAVGAAWWLFMRKDTGDSAAATTPPPPPEGTSGLGLPWGWAARARRRRVVAEESATPTARSATAEESRRFKHMLQARQPRCVLVWDQPNGVMSMAPPTGSSRRHMPPLSLARAMQQAEQAEQAEQQSQPMSGMGDVGYAGGLYSRHLFSGMMGS